MYVYGYSDDEILVYDSVTLISRLDVRNPLHLYPNDYAALTVISMKLKGTENYQVQSCAMLHALEGKSKIDMENEVDISALTMEQYTALIPDDIKPGIVNPKIGDDVEFKRNQSSAFVSNVPNNRNFQTNQTSNNTPRPNIVKNNRQCEVHKLAKDNKIFVAFNQSRCYFLNQDLNLKNVLRIVINVKVYTILVIKIPNDDKRVDPSLNSDYKSQSDSSHYSVPSEGINIDDFPTGKSKNDAQSNYETFATQNEQLNKNSKPKTFFEAFMFPHWTEVVNNEMDALLRNDTWEITELPKDRKAIRNDIIITGNSISEIEKFNTFLKCKFMIKDLRELKYFFGIEVIDTDKGICLNQRKYVIDLFPEYGMLDCKPAKTPLHAKLIITNEASIDDPLLDNITDYLKVNGKVDLLD
ncbi:ribonuclease H-like domain-containing protein [Tanacetum coccineum]